MKRREFIAGLGGVAAWPLAGRAQQPAVPVVGYLSGRSPADSGEVLADFRRGLAEAGFVEGRNVTIGKPPTRNLCPNQSRNVLLQTSPTLTIIGENFVQMKPLTKIGFLWW
jgi:hypothetical protein